MDWMNRNRNRVTLGWIKREYSRDSRDEYEFEDSSRDGFGFGFGFGFGWIGIFVYVSIYVLYTVLYCITVLLYCITIVTIAKMIPISIYERGLEIPESARSDWRDPLGWSALKIY